MELLTDLFDKIIEKLLGGIQQPITACKYEHVETCIISLNDKLTFRQHHLEL